MMTLVNGKFFNDGNPYPLEFGNKDQLKLIDKVKWMLEEGLNPTLLLDDNDEYSGMSIKCVCGSTVQVDFKDPEDFSDLEGEKRKCPGCNFKYLVCLTDDDSFPYFKLI